MHKLRTIVALAALTGTLACTADIGGPYAIEARDDLTGFGYEGRIENGLSNTIEFHIEPDTESFLIEVAGERGIYSMVELKTPSGRELIEDAGFTSRGSRANYGLANWMYPNAPGLKAESGTYRMVIRGTKTLDGGTVSEDIEVRVYSKKRSGEEECGIQIDFMIDEDALALSDIEEALERITMETDSLLAQGGIRIADYSLVRVKLPTADVNVEERSVLPVVDDVLAQARRQGYARDGAMHIMLVRSIGGGSDPKGRSLGLPGPYTADRANAAVLIATDHFQVQGFLNTDDLSETLTHEMGHYMGLFHTSELPKKDENGISTGTRDKHDPIDDTPECTTGSCGNEYNLNIMSTGSTRRRQVLTDGQAKVMRSHPLCIPLSQTSYQPPPPPPACTLDCEAPETCVIWDNAPQCLEACDPDINDLDQCDTFCTTSDDNVFVCRP